MYQSTLRPSGSSPGGRRSGWDLRERARSAKPALVLTACWPVIREQEVCEAFCDSPKFFQANLCLPGRPLVFRIPHPDRLDLFANEFDIEVSDRIAEITDQFAKVCLWKVPNHLRYWPTVRLQIAQRGLGNLIEKPFSLGRRGARALNSRAALPHMPRLLWLEGLQWHASSFVSVPRSRGSPIRNSLRFPCPSNCSERASPALQAE